MKNRQKLHDYGLVLILLGILHFFTFVATVITDIVDGTMSKALATVEPDILVAVKVTLVIFGVIAALIVLADVFIGIKALKVSANPSAAKGHITAAKVFFVLSVIATISAIVTLFDANASILDTVLNLVDSALGAVVYVYFIGAAQAVRRDVINGVN